MITVVEIAPVVKSIEVSRSAADAFRIFAAEIGAWWPKATHSLADAAAGETSRTVTIEPRVGGRVFETLADGRELDWGEVLKFEPGAALRLAWRLGRPAAQETYVHVRFEPLGPSRCRVTLTHEGWERLGAEGPAMRDGYNSGWVEVFETCYAQAAA